MKYVPPYGSTDPNASYVNGDPSIARQGSIPPAATFEEPMREIVAAIQYNGFIPSDADLVQLFQGTRSQFGNYAKDTGSVNTLSVAFSPPLAKYTVGLPIRVQVNQTNTSACTIDAGCGRVYVRRPDGSNLQHSDLPAGGITDLVFDGTGFQMVNYLGSSAVTSITNNFNQIPYAVDTSPTANIIQAPFSPAITAIAAGDLFLVKVANTTTGPTSLSANALPAHPVKATGGGGDLMQNDISAGDVKLFIYDGTNLQVAPNFLINATWTMSVPTPAYPTPAAAFIALQRKRISLTATVNIVLASGTYAPFNIYHPDADRIAVIGTMLGAFPGTGDLVATGADYNAIIANGWTNLSILKSRMGTIVSCGNGQIGITNAGPGNPSIYNILCMGPYNSAANPGNPAAWWDGSMGIYCPDGRAMTCTNVACWGFGFASFEVRGYMYCNTCIGTANINGLSTRYAQGYAESVYCMWVSNLYTGINADEQSGWTGSSDFIRGNGGDGIQPLNMGYCGAHSCQIFDNAGLQTHALRASVSWIPGSYVPNGYPPANGPPSADGSFTFF
jgi:hypothetical protein